jgi:excisionase family DNA binding protein
MTTREVAARLGVTTRQVARLVKAGRLDPAFTVPGARGAHMFDPSEVERYHSERRAA